MKTRFLAIVLFIAFAAGSRLLPHPPNVAPIAAMALFAGATLSDIRLAVLVPLTAMTVSDLILGFHATIPFVYGSFLLIAGIGTLLRTRRTMRGIAAASVASSVLFFVVTNFGVWATTAMYPKTAAGLGLAYAAGLPFFRNTVLGDLFYCVVLFGGFALLERGVPAVRSARGQPPGGRPVAIPGH